jgi:hypothetical protein
MSTITRTISLAACCAAALAVFAAPSQAHTLTIAAAQTKAYDSGKVYELLHDSIDHFGFYATDFGFGTAKRVKTPVKDRPGEFDVHRVDVELIVAHRGECAVLDEFENCVRQEETQACSVFIPVSFKYKSHKRYKLVVGNPYGKQCESGVMPPKKRAPVPRPRGR